MRTVLQRVCGALLISLSLGGISENRAQADVIGSGIEVIGEAISVAACRTRCETERDECLENVLDNYGEVHDICRALDDDGQFPYDDTYYACMTAGGFGNPANPTDPLGPLRAIATQRAACRAECEACKRRCTGRAIRSGAGIIGGYTGGVFGR